ncbi:MAG: universal stress protein, partial [Bdellovibrionota bacterium]
MKTKTVTRNKKFVSLNPSLATFTGNKVVWAVDPLEGETDRMKAVSAAIRVWSKDRSLEVMPLSVVSPAAWNWPIELLAPFDEKVLFIAAERLKPVIQKAMPGHHLEPRVLLQHGFSQRAAALQFLEWSRQNDAQIIVVTSHGRRGFDRFRL